jgi:hypothetical protein
VIDYRLFAPSVLSVPLVRPVHPGLRRLGLTPAQARAKWLATLHRLSLRPRALTPALKPQPLLIENINRLQSFINYHDLANSGTLSV